MKKDNQSAHSIEQIETRPTTAHWEWCAEWEEAKVWTITRNSKRRRIEPRKGHRWGKRRLRGWKKKQRKDSEGRKNRQNGRIITDRMTQNDWIEWTYNERIRWILMKFTEIVLFFFNCAMQFVEKTHKVEKHQSHEWCLLNCIHCMNSYHFMPILSLFPSKFDAVSTVCTT